MAYKSSEADAPVLGELQKAAAIEALNQALPEEPVKPGSIRIPIFIYHSIRPYPLSDSQNLRDYEITPELFEKELKYLQDNGYVPISLDELAADMKVGMTFPIPKPVVLTFDDGWQNQYKYAFPLLKKYYMTGTFFVFTNSIGKPHFLTWNNLKEMQAAGMTIGSHTLSHPYLNGLSLTQVKTEVIKSKKILEDHLGKPVVHFASPFGYTNPDIMAIVKSAGYTTGRTTYKGVYQDDPFRLKGILVDESFSDFTAALK